MLPVWSEMKLVAFIFSGIDLNHAIICKMIDEMRDHTTYRIFANHEVPTTQYNSHLLHRSNCNFSKCSLDKDIVFSKETDSLWCLPFAQQKAIHLDSF